MDEAVDTVDLDLHPNEASDLAVVPAGAVDRYDQTFVTVLDEGVIEQSIAILGHRGDDVTRLGGGPAVAWTPADHAARTEDAEACDFLGDHLYMLGSHFGSKDGPLEAKRAWIARVATADLAAAVAGEHPPIEIARNRFGLHRAFNDRLSDSGVELRELGAAGARAARARTVERGAEEGQGAGPTRVQPGRPADQHRRDAAS